MSKQYSCASSGVPDAGRERLSPHTPDMPGAAAKRHHGDILRAAGLLVYLLICVLVFVACGRADVSAGLEPPGNITENRDTDTDTDANAKAEALKGRISSVLPAEDPDGRTVILYFGDAQPWQSVDEYASFGALVNLARTISPDADFALQCGDMVNGGDIPEEWGAFMDAAAPALMGLPLLAAPGNHEVSPYVNESGRKPQFYLDVFELPENGPEGFEEEYYSVDFGSVHVISLSANYLDPAESYSDDKAENAQIAARIDDWIAQDLSETGRPWKIVLMHQPAFTYEGDSTQAAMLARWVPIFERTGVDLILCGHQHQISRSYPLRGGVEDMENGIVQIMGNASVKAYTSSGMAHPQFAFEAAGVRGWHRIVAGSRALSVTAYDSDGRALDVWEKIAAA